MFVIDNVVLDQWAKQVFQELAIPWRANITVEKLGPEEVAAHEFLKGGASINFLFQ